MSLDRQKPSRLILLLGFLFILYPPLYALLFVLPLVLIARWPSLLLGALLGLLFGLFVGVMQNYLVLENGKYELLRVAPTLEALRGLLAGCIISFLLKEKKFGLGFSNPKGIAFSLISAFTLLFFLTRTLGLWEVRSALSKAAYDCFCAPDSECHLKKYLEKADRQSAGRQTYGKGFFERACQKNSIGWIHLEGKALFPFLAFVEYRSLRDLNEGQAERCPCLGAAPLKRAVVLWWPSSMKALWEGTAQIPIGCPGIVF